MLVCVGLPVFSIRSCKTLLRQRPCRCRRKRLDNAMCSKLRNTMIGNDRRGRTVCERRTYSATRGVYFTASVEQLNKLNKLNKNMMIITLQYEYVLVRVAILLHTASYILCLLPGNFPTSAWRSALMTTARHGRGLVGCVSVIPPARLMVNPQCCTIVNVLNEVLVCSHYCRHPRFCEPWIASSDPNKSCYLS